MTHAWSSDPARDARVRLEEDGLSSPRPTLEEAIKAVNAARQEGTAEYFRRISRLMCEHMQKQQWDKAMHPLDAASKANAAARERDRANEARARYRKRWQERGKTIAKLQARLSERQSGAVNASLRKWCQVVEDQRDVLKLQREEATSEAASLKKLVSTYGDRIAELHKANKQLDEGYNAAVLAVAEATNKRLEAEGERDAAIRERDEMRKSWLRSEESGTRLLAECNAALDAADGLRKRVAELEAASGGGEPVAWMVEWTDHAELYGSKTQAERAAAGDVVPQPLYCSPPQPSGWLTEEQKQAVCFFADWLDNEVRECCEVDRNKSILRNLLARSTPPEVVLDAFPTDETGEFFSRRDVIKAIAAAGVAVKEVGDED